MLALEDQCQSSFSDLKKVSLEENAYNVVPNVSLIEFNFLYHD